MKKDNYIGKILLGKYKILNLISQGGMDSNIYLAQDITYEDNNYLCSKYKHAAIKIIQKNNNTPEDQWQKILDEGTTIGRLSRKKNIVKLYDFTLLDSDTILIAMEYIDGLTLTKYILDNGNIELNESIYIFEKILLAVNELHNNSNIIIHRDLKPDNIIISRDLCKIKLIDFGISSVLQKTKDNKNELEVVTNEESFYGTVPYLSPDILNFRNQSKENFGQLITKQFDFHSLGIIFYEMIVGHKPFYYENDEEPNNIKLPLDYDIVPMKTIFNDFPNDIENIIIRLIASKKEDYKFRYSSIEEILSDIKNYKLRIKQNIDEPNTIKDTNNRKLQFPAKFNIKMEEKKGNYKVLFCSYIFIFITILLLLILLSLIIIRAL